MNNGNSKKVCFLIVFHDMLKLVGYWFWTITFVSLLAIIYVVQQFDIFIDLSGLAKTLLNIIPEIMGFLIAGLAIIMGFNEVTLERLSKPANDGEKPLLVIIASFSVCLLILLVTLIVSTMYVNIAFVCEGFHRLLGTLVIYCAVISIESVIHGIFHLFATGTYIVKKKDNEYM